MVGNPILLPGKRAENSNTIRSTKQRIKRTGGVRTRETVRMEEEDNARTDQMMRTTTTCMRKEKAPERPGTMTATTKRLIGRVRARDPEGGSTVTHQTIESNESECVTDVDRPFDLLASISLARQVIAMCFRE